MKSSIKYGITTAICWNIFAVSLMSITAIFKDSTFFEYFNDETNGIGTMGLMLLWTIIAFYVGHGLRKEFLSKQELYKKEYPTLDSEIFSKCFKAYFFKKYYRSLSVVFFTAIPWYILGYVNDVLENFKTHDKFIVLLFMILSLFFHWKYIQSKKKISI